MIVRIEYRGIPVELHGEMVGGAFAAWGAEVLRRDGTSFADTLAGQKRDAAYLLGERPKGLSVLSDLESLATEWYAKQPTLAWRVVAGYKTHGCFYCTDCGVPEGTVEVERVIDAADLNDDGVLKVCPTCGEYVHKDERGKT